MNGPIVRAAEERDLPTIQTIYAHHVLHGLASFEETAPDLPEITRRWRTILTAELPYLVCEDGGAVVGYAYAGPYRPRPAYRYSLENTVYIAPDLPRRGYGRLLLSALIDRCTALGYRQMIAVIGDSANHGSIGLHASLGFKEVGMLPAVGYKFGRWVDSVIMQRPLGEGDTTTPPER